MTIATAVVGARKIGQTIIWTDLDGDVKDLTDAVITGVIFDLDTGETRASDGSLAVTTDGADGSFDWGYGAVDVGTAGRFMAQFIATYPDSKKAITHPTEWFVYKAFTVS